MTTEFINSIFNCRNKTAIVTGASSGIGKHCALTLAKAGANVVINARRKHLLEELKQEIEQYGVSALIVEGDLTEEKTIQRLWEVASNHFDDISILVNNIGMANLAPYDQIDSGNWDEQINANLKTPWLMSQAAAKYMSCRNIAGSIINISTIGASRPVAGSIPYCVAKAGLEHLTKALVAELSTKKIRINAIAPGAINTEMSNEKRGEQGNQFFEQVTPLKYIAELEELDGVLLLLASNKASSYITGGIIPVDGGLSTNSFVIS